jgi:hypothetical protein
LVSPLLALPATTGAASHLFIVIPRNIEQFCHKSRDIVDQASLLWQLIHFQIHNYGLNHQDWTFVRYEDLVRDPLSGFKDLFQRADLPFTKEVQARIAHDSGAANHDGSSNPYSIQRDSKAQAVRWKQLLTSAEIDRIKNNVANISSLFYADAEW